MAPQWQRWLRYAKAKLDATVQDGEREMDRLEAEQAAAAEGKPWLSSTGDAPTFDEAKARIEDRSRRSPLVPPGDASDPSDPEGTSGPALTSAPKGGPAGAGPSSSTPPSSPSGTSPVPSGDDAFDAEAHRRAAADRLAAIRDELGLGDDPPPGDDDGDVGEDVPPPTS